MDMIRKVIFIYHHLFLCVKTLCDTISLHIAHRCPVLLPPPMGRISGPCVNFYGTTCTIECSPGFSIQGSMSATCQRNDVTSEMFWEYEDSVPTCKGK